MSDEHVRGIGVDGCANAIGDRNIINSTVNHYASAPPVISSLHQLPSPPAGFVGRERELTELRASVVPNKATMLGFVGMGGIGKTSLALRLANDLKDLYPDAGLYIDLKGIEAEPVHVSAALKHFIRAFEPQAQLPDDELQLQGIYRTLLNSKRAIVLLDNAKDQSQVAPLLPPHSCALIVTSRHYFTVSGLVPQNLTTLLPEDACELLLKAAPRIGPFAGEMARMLGYLPLALRLASGAMAAKRNLTPEHYLRRLSDAQTRLELVKAPLQLSYNLLNPKLQMLWRTLSAFPGTFEEVAAAVVWDIDMDSAADSLGDLISLSMVEFDEATQRYHLHDLARDFATVQLSDSESFIIGKRHSMHYCNVLLKASSLFREGHNGMMLGLQMFEKERLNIESGQLWATSNASQDEEAARMSINFSDSGAHILYLRKSPREQVAWLEGSLAAAKQLRWREAEGCAIGNLGIAYKNLGEIRRAIEYHEQHLIIAREIGNRRGEGNALGNLGIAYANLGETQRAITYHQQNLEIKREIGDRHGESNAVGNLGLAYTELGAMQRANEYYEQYLTIAREIGDRQEEGNALGCFGLFYAKLGQIQNAIQHYEKCLEIACEIGDRRGEGNALGNLGIAYADLGEMQRAIEYYERHLLIAREIGDRRGKGNCFWNMSLIRLESGDRVGALEMANQALSIYKQIESPAAEKVQRIILKWQNTNE